MSRSPNRLNRSPNDLNHSPSDRNMHQQTLREKRAFWTALDRVVKEVPEHEQLFVLMDANARTGRRGRCGVRSMSFSVPTAEIVSSIIVIDSFYFCQLWACTVKYVLKYYQD